MFTPTDIAWAAGFLEGEGWLKLTGRTHLCLAASQVDREPLDRLASIFGGMVYGPRKTKTQPIYTWQVTGRVRAQAALAAMWSWLSVHRRDQWTPALVAANTHRFKYEMEKKDAVV